MWVGANSIIPNKEYASLETLAMALELVLASKWLLDSNIPKAIPSYRGHRLPLMSTAPNQYIIDWHEHVQLAISGTGMLLGLGLRMF